jgi:hypothetical protein
MTRYSLPAFLALATSALAVLLMLVLYPSPAEAQRAAISSCPSTMPNDATELLCRCSASDGSGTVWGTDYYTDDSRLCAAAVHAGAIPASGGIVGVQTRPGRSSYLGTVRNGIETNDYGQWGRTIVFSDPASLAGNVDDAQCPGVYNAGGTGWSGTCRCVGSGDGPVWGSGPYTADSDLCRAARHAGAIGPAGGLIHVTSAPGQNSYSGTTRNGVTTSSWGSYGASFRVNR